jgi:molybdopterin/thiamine biosynthesis adenylyltransferase
MTLSRDEQRRYSRQIVLGSIGAAGQRMLKRARVSVIGVGGLGCFSSIQLAAMGVGFLRLIDQDIVDLTNLHRQILYPTDAIGYPKVEIAQQRLHALNPHVDIEPLPLTITRGTAEAAVHDVDVVIDGLDRFAPRYAINAACVKQGIPYIYAGALETYGNVGTIVPGESACLECILGELSDEGRPTCETAGVLTPVLATLASIQVSEALHVLLHRPPQLLNKILFVNFTSLNFLPVDVVRRDDCPTCGTSSTPAPTPRTSTVVALCGKESFMAAPASPLSLDIPTLAQILQAHYTITLQSAMGLGLERQGVSINLMKTGNALITGVPTEADATRVYDDLLKYLGHS